MKPLAIAFVPAAPLLVPAVAGGSAPVDAALRDACLGVVAEATADSPEAVVVVAATAEAGCWPSSARPDLSGFGVGAPPQAEPRLPWPLGIGAWFLDAAGWRGDRRYVGVSEVGAPAALPALGSVAVLAVGDGSGCRTERAPGHLDPRAEPFDEAIAAALAAGDSRALAGVDPQLAQSLLCGSVAVWRWVDAALDGGQVDHADLRRHEAPYGVGYFAAVWRVS